MKWTSDLWTNKLRWYPQQPQRFIFTNIIWSVLRSQALETPQPAPKPPRPSPEPSPEPCWTWPASAQSLPEPSPEPSPEPCWSWLGLSPIQGFLEPSPEPPPQPCWTWPASHQSLQTFSGTFSGTPVELDLPLHKASQTFSRTFSETLLNLTWLCTKASQAFSKTFYRTRWTWLGFAARLPGTFSGNLLRNPVEPDLALHQSLPASPEPAPEPSPEPCWTWPVSAPKTFYGTFGTFSGTSLNLTRRLHQCTPELFWAEDPISLRCWGTKMSRAPSFGNFTS